MEAQRFMEVHCPVEVLRRPVGVGRRPWGRNDLRRRSFRRGSGLPRGRVATKQVSAWSQGDDGEEQMQGSAAGAGKTCGAATAAGKKRRRDDPMGARKPAEQRSIEAWWPTGRKGPRQHADPVGTRQLAARQSMEAVSGGDAAPRWSVTGGGAAIRWGCGSTWRCGGR
ncbi:unnamed protein product [Urochloa humidicola]